MITKTRIEQTLFRGVLFYAVSCAYSLQAQSVIAPMPQYYSTQPSPSTRPGQARNSVSHSGIASAFLAGSPLVQWNAVGVRPHLRYQLLAVDGLLSRPGETENTTIHTIDAGVFFELGQHWTLDYTATNTRYSNQRFENTLGHSVRLDGGISHGNWALGFSQDYISDSPLSVETGSQVEQETYTTQLRTTYSVGQKTRIELAGSRAVRFANVFTASTPDLLKWSLATWLHYAFSSRVTSAVGIEYGFDDLSSGTDQTYIRPQIQVDWRPTEKVTIGITGGIDQRRFQDSNIGSSSTPIYTVSLRYRPFTTTTIEIQTSRNLRESYSVNENVKSSGWSASLEQRLLRRLYLRSHFSQNMSRYISTVDEDILVRHDKYYSFHSSLSMPISRRGSIALLYQRSNNSSRYTNYSFTSHQFGGEIEFRF